MDRISLSRNLGLFSATMIGIGGMIGAGIFALTGIAAGIAGSSVALVFILNGLLTLPTAMAYAELASSLPRAGGGYAIIQEGLGGANGFLAGWMSLFAYIAAGALYALAFARFAAKGWLLLGLPAMGLGPEGLAGALTACIITVFTGINMLGATEAARVGNIVTMSKVLVLILFVLAGLVALAHHAAAVHRITADFLPHGAGGILVAMGLTYVAFEGFEIIAQSGEEVTNPKHTLPRAIFLSIGIVLVLYVGVGLVTFGMVTPPPGISPHAYLGSLKEMAVVEAAKHVFSPGLGNLLLLASGLAATVSALNVTMYSASRVALAMGREGHLPAWFARVGPNRHTPWLAVLASGLLMLGMATFFPIEQAAAAGSLMFLLLFMQVNMTLLVLRRKKPEMPRPYAMPWAPLLPLAAITGNAMLALQLFTYSPLVWYAASFWIMAGALIYYAYLARQQVREKRTEVAFEEVLVSRDYSVLAAVERQADARALGTVAATIAKAEKGEVLALHVICVPGPLGISEGKRFIESARKCIEPVRESADELGVPVHSVVRLSRDVDEAIRDTALENETNLILLRYGAPPGSRGRLFGSIIDPLLAEPPCDVAVVHPVGKRTVQRILVPVTLGPGGRKIIGFARAFAAHSQPPCTVVLLHVTASKAETEQDAEALFAPLLEGPESGKLETRLVAGRSVATSILEASEECQLVIMGATTQPLFKRLLMGDIPKRVLRRARTTTIVLKPARERISEAAHGIMPWLRRWAGMLKQWPNWW
jgi:amino acid transporter/nucleotide-binding universal stress UspA family protein